MGAFHLKSADVQNMLVIGVDAAALASSAKKAGHAVFGVDHFGDLDFNQACNHSLSIVKQQPGKSCGRFEIDYSAEKLLKLAKSMLAAHPTDACLLASGLEDSPTVLRELSKLVPIIGNSPTTIRKARDKMEFFRELERLGVCYPKTRLVEDRGLAARAAKDIGYPIVVKPLTGFGGAGIRKARNKRELAQLLRKTVFPPSGILIQEFLSGLNASMSILTSRSATILLTLNRQLLGIEAAKQKEQFGYCGNIVPAYVKHTVLSECRNVAQKIASHFSLIGSNGIDVIISKDAPPHVVELNPRFQGTLECVEHVLGINLVEAHLEACLEGTLHVVGESKPANCCIRLILFAGDRLAAPDLTEFENARDIPLPGAVVEEGEPLCSIVVEETEKEHILRKAENLAQQIYARVVFKPKSQL